MFIKSMILIAFLVNLLLVLPIRANEDPYSVLGISSKASIKEIKRAYKALAKQWHPDKNADIDAHDRFMSIARAYEVLSDPLKRERYDKYGTFDEPPALHQYAYHPFEDIFNFGFGGFDNGNSYFQRHRISLRMYSHSLLERSFSQPYIIFAYSGYCQLCFRLEPIWQSIVEDLEPLGYGIATVNAMSDRSLLDKLRISWLPAVAVLVEGRVLHYRGSLQPLSAKSVRLFARDVIPNTYLIKITSHDGLRRFIDQWKESNKISVLILSSKEDPRIRYLLSAMKFSTVARFAHVYLNDRNTDVAKMRQALDIKCFKCENILIFNDFPQDGPLARLSTIENQQFNVEAIDRLVEVNKYLVLPRLSSDEHFDDLCPFSSRSLRKFCVILVVTDAKLDEKYINLLRNFTRKQTGILQKDRIRITYIYSNKQKNFVAAFPSANNLPQKLILLWRFDHKQARFAWLKTSLESADMVSFEIELKSELQNYVQSNAKLEHIVSLKPLVNEHSPSWFTRLSRSFVRMSEAAWFHLTKEETLPLLSAIGTFMLIIFIGFGLNLFMSADGRYRSYTRKNENTQNRNQSHDEEQWHPEDPRTAPEINNNTRARVLTRQQRIMREMEPMIHELRAETYFGMIRLLKPGCRSIVILLDEQSKNLLLPKFAIHVWPFRNNKTFSFGYLLVEKNLAWFRKLLEHTLPAESGETNKDGTKSLYERLKNINSRKTLGTVLVLCGWKLYFNMYHPMLTAPGKTNFLGFDEDSDSSRSSDPDVDGPSHEMIRTSRKGQNLKLENVLDGFSNWLDRLLEGSIRRYYIPEWPDNLR